MMTTAAPPTAANTQDPATGSLAWTAWEVALLAGILCLSATLGFANLAAPSLWHDELVHVFVARNLLEHGTAQLPSGEPYYSGAVFNTVLAGTMAVAGDGEFAVRAPSVLFGMFNILLLYLLVRAWAGRSVAITAALLLTLSPWSVAWARQARFYTLQQTCYLATLGMFWNALAQRDASKRALGYSLAALASFLLAVLTAYHSILFLVPLGSYLLLHFAARHRRADLYFLAGIAVAGVLALFLMRLLMNPTDVQATTTHSGLGLHLDSMFTWNRWYYLGWLEQNLSTGFFLLLFPGALLLVTRHGWRGAYWLLAFAGPLLALTLLLEYRWSRFIFFAYPAAVLFQAVALVAAVQAVARFRRGIAHATLALCLLLFLLRLARSAADLTADSVAVARGADTTLATHHPQWRTPCRWVGRQAGNPAILATSFLPVQYYTGRVDDWFPNNYFGWESQDSGLPGLGSIEALSQFMQTHPSGYYIAESERFERWRQHGAVRDELAPMVEWVRTHMTRIPAASSADVSVYAWGAAAISAPQ